jgi:hypothetical protein
VNSSFYIIQIKYSRFVMDQNNFKLFNFEYHMVNIFFVVIREGGLINKNHCY